MAKREPNGAVQREVLPIPDVKPVAFTTYDAKDPETKYPPIRQLRPPAGAPNVLVILIDDVGFGASSAFGGSCQTPAAERQPMTAATLAVILARRPLPITVRAAMRSPAPSKVCNSRLQRTPRRRITWFRPSVP